MQSNQSSSGAGISALDPVAAALYAGATGDARAGLIPLLRSPARSLALSRVMKKPQTYNAPMMNFLTKGASLRNPSMAITGGASPQLREYNPFE